MQQTQDEIARMPLHLPFNWTNLQSIFVIRVYMLERSLCTSKVSQVSKECACGTIKHRSVALIELSLSPHPPLSKSIYFQGIGWQS